MDLFESALAVLEEELEIEFRGVLAVPWSDFLLNPRRLRGSDFLMRWSQGVWSEERVVDAINRTRRYFAIPYGPSGTAPSEDPQETELYFERLAQAGLGEVKRPDLIVFAQQDKVEVERALRRLGGVEELPFTSEEALAMKNLLGRAVIALECENSLWRVADMPAYGEELRPMRRLGGRPGLPKNSVLPTIILKEEDRQPLAEWQDAHSIAIDIWHVFYDKAYGIAFDRAEELIKSGLIEVREQVFQAPGGATTKKGIYKIYYQYAYPVAEASQEPELVADHIIDKNGHILPYVRFKGGSLDLSPEALAVLDAACGGS